MSKSAVVTGCFGFIGSHLVDLLLSRGYRIFGVGRQQAGKKCNSESFIDSPDFELINDDVTQLDGIPNIPDEIETIYHLATARSPIDLTLLTEVNVIGTVKVLEFARKNDIDRVVFSSSAAVYGNTSESPITEKTQTCPMSFYASSKLVAEEYFHVYERRYGLESSILRYFNVYGPRKADGRGAIINFINQTLRDEPITLEGDGTYRYTPIYVSDVVEATYIAGQAQAAANSIINICGNEVLQLSEIVERIRELIEGSKSKLQFNEPRSNWGESHIGSTESMRLLLDFTPKVSFEDALMKTIEWYRSTR